jgi:flagellar protein FlbD
MITVTRLNGASVTLNADLIELIESTPDTLISLTTGNKVNVLEPVEVVLARILEYRRACHASLPAVAAPAPAGDAGVEGR